MATRRRSAKKKINWEWIGLGVLLVAIPIFSFAKNRITAPALPAGNGGTAGSDTPPLPPPGTKNSYNCNLPRGLRNNNPGNLRSGNWQGVVTNNTDYNCATKKIERKYLQFETIEFGILPLIDIVYKAMFPVGTSLRNILSQIPNASGSPSYLDSVSKIVGVGPDTILLLTRANVEKIVKAIARFENGRDAITSAQFEFVWTVLFNKPK